MSPELRVPIITSLSFAHPAIHTRQREPLTIAESELAKALGAVMSAPEELAVVSTCLRHEVITVGADEARLHELVMSMSEVRSLPPGATFRYGRAAVDHLFRVASGLCSPVVGEPEVLGQVRRAHRAAVKAEVIGPILDQLFREAINTGRAARELIAEPDTGSIAAIGVDNLKARHPGRLLLVGAGEMANAVCDAIADSDWDIVRVTRRPDRIGGDALGLDALESELIKADVAVTAVTSTRPLIEADMLGRVVGGRDRTLAIIDLGMPPNVADHANTVEADRIDYVGIDDLAEDESHTRSTEGAEDYVETRSIEVHARVMNTTLSPLIQAVREKAEHAAQEELDRALARIPDANEHQQAVLTRLARTLTNRLLHDPLLYLSSHPEATTQSETARSILGIEDD